jgi:outer membrane protein assembly factor BamA
VCGGTTDIGVGAGGFAGVTRVRQGYEPYVWNLESAGLVTFKPSEGSGIFVPYQDLYMQLGVPRLFGSASELRVRASYTSESTLRYYGVGDSSSDAPSAGRTSSYFSYARTHPSLLLDLRLPVVAHVVAHVGARYTHNWLDVPAGSKLADDMRSAEPAVRSLLGPTRSHAVALFAYGVQWDDRDSEVSPHRGSLDEAAVRLSPGGAGSFPYRYGEATIDARLYVPLGSRRLTLALRTVGDVLFGDPPFYALPRVDDDYAVGGLNGVRGVPAGRYLGKAKVFGSAEVRADITEFRALARGMLFGLAAFFDAGRVWADTAPHPELDGTGLGLKYGVGGGVRLQSGKAFVLRGDIAWSPDARPLGAYFAIGQTF